MGTRSKLLLKYTVCFDKTETLTTGKLTVCKITLFPNKDISSEDELLYYAATAELGSEHPLGKAIVEHYRKEHTSPELISPLQLQTLPGQGIRSLLQDGKTVHVGNAPLMSTLQSTQNYESEDIYNMKKQGKTVVFVSVDNAVVGAIVLSDTLKPSAVQVVSRIRDEYGIKVCMITGDDARTAIAIGDQLGIEHENIVAGALPSRKAEKIEELQKNGAIVAMVGDGVNDAVAFIYNVIMLPIAAGALYVPLGVSIPPVIAGFNELLSSLPVIFFSLLLHRYKPPQQY